MAKRSSRTKGKSGDNGRDRRRQDAIALSDRALEHHDAGRYAEAEPLYRQALAIHDDLGGHHPQHAVALNNLALLLKQTGRYDEAGRYHCRLVDMARTIFGEEHFGYATALHNLGNWCHVMRRYAEAEPHLRQALAIRRATLGERHDDYVKALGSLGLVLNAMERRDEAEPLLRRAVEIRREILGERHPSYAKSLDNLAVLCRDARRYGESEPLFRQALDIAPDNATVMNNLGLLCFDTGRYDEAERLIRRALELDRAAGRDRHPDHAITLNNLMLVQSRQVAEIRREMLGEQHPDYAIALKNLAIYSAARLDGTAAPEGMDTKSETALSRLEALIPKVIPAVIEDPKSRSILVRFYRIGGEYELRGATSQGKVGKILGVGKNNLSLYFKEIEMFLNLKGGVFRRIVTAGGQERIPGLTEAGRTVWRLLADVLNLEHN